MSFVKMTEILASTSAFIVTLTYPTKAKSHGFREWNWDIHSEALIEITPIIQSATDDIGLAEKFFQIISADSTQHNRRLKDHVLQSFVKRCTKRIFEQFWDSAEWKTLEWLSIRIPTVTCILYDKEGNVVHLKTTSALDVMKALRAIEEAFFISARIAPFVMHDYDKKNLKREKNRQTRKYFMHHRSM